MQRAKLQGCLYVCVWLQVCVCVCVPGGGAVHVAYIGTDQRRRIIFGHVCTSLQAPPPFLHIHRSSIIEHNKNQQIRRQRLMWTDKSRKWIWKPPPALCHISLHSVADKQDASPFCLTAPFAVFFLSPSLTTTWLVQEMWVELTGVVVVVVVVPLSTHANLNKLMSGWVNAMICLGALGGLLGRSLCVQHLCVCVCVWAGQGLWSVSHIVKVGASLSPLHAEPNAVYGWTNIFGTLQTEVGQLLACNQHRFDNQGIYFCLFLRKRKKSNNW